MTRHPINAFFRRGQPIPLTGTDFAIRYGEDRAHSRAVMIDLHQNGFIREVVTQGCRTYELTDAGVGYARSVLCIRVAA